jgi:hypothetical protein
MVRLDSRVFHALRNEGFDTLSTSWPDLFRPSTTCVWGKKDVDGRDKRGHDARECDSI